MIVTITNLTDHTIFVDWFRPGPLGAGQSDSRAFSSEEVYGIAGILKKLSDLNKISVSVTNEPTLLDKVEVATIASITSSNVTVANNHILVGGVDGVAHDVAMSGEATITNTGAITLANSAVISKAITGFVSGAGGISAADTLLQALNKLDGNIAVVTANIASYS
jgi:hypothetical protein